MNRTIKRIGSLLLTMLLLAGALVLPASAAAPKAITGTATYVSASQALGASELAVAQTTDFEYNDSWFAAPSTKYNHDLARMTLTLNKSSWTAADAMNANNDNAKADAIGYTDAAEYVDKLYKDLGFTPLLYSRYDVSLNDEQDKIAYSFAEKKLTLDGENCVLLAVTMRGGNYGGEWVSNGYVGTGNAHAGFDLAAKDLLPVLRKQIDSYDKDLTVKLWMNGYSRSGSVSNLVAADLDRDIAKGSSRLKKENLFCYNFAVPLCTKDSDAGNAMYDNIINITNPVDIVMGVPLRDWGFDRYGVQKYLNFLEPGEKYDKLDAELAAAFEGMCDEEFTLHMTTWDQFQILCLIDALVPLFLSSTDALAGFEDGMKNLIRSFFVQGVLIENITGGKWAAAYTNIIGEDRKVWDPVSRVMNGVAKPINTVGAWFGKEQTVDPDLLSFIVSMVYNVVSTFAGNDADVIGLLRKLPGTLESLVRVALSAIGTESSEQGFIDNIKVAHSTESYMILLNQPESEAFGSGEIHKLRVH